MEIAWDNLEKGKLILDKAGVIDCHCDTAANFENPAENRFYCFGERNNSMHIDLPRLKEGNVKLQFFALCLEAEGDNYQSAFQKTCALIERYWQNIQQNAGEIGHVSSASDLNRLNEHDRMASLLALEGAGSIGEEIALLQLFYRLGVRCISLTWNYRNQLGDGLYEKETGGGLTRAGKKAVRAMNELGIMLDLAHLSPAGYYQAMELTELPPLVSHANAWGVCSHSRNLSDEQLKVLSQKNGVIGVSFYPPFIKNSVEASLEDLLEHYVYMAELIGVEHLGIGSDFDGINVTVNEIYDCTCYKLLAAGLLEKGFLPYEIELIFSGNVRNLLYNVIP